MAYRILIHSIAILISLVSVLSVSANQPDESTVPNSQISLLLEKADRLVKVATNHDSVLTILNQADQLIKLPEDSHQAINVLLLRGLNEYYFSNYEKAVETYYDALDQAELIRDSVLIAKAYQYLGRIFDEMEDYNEAISYFQKSIEICRIKNDTTLLAKSFQNIAICYQNKKDLGKAIEYNEKAEQLARLRKDTTMIIDLTNNMGTIAYDQKEMEKALSFYQKALELYRKINDKQGVAMAYNNIGLVYLDEKEYQKSLDYFSRSLEMANQLKMYDFIGDIYSNLTIYYAAIKDYKNAYHYYDEYNIVYDSLAGEKKTKMIRMIQAKFQLRKTHRDMEDLKQRNEVQLQSIDYARSVQTYLLAVTLIVILLMATTIFLLLREKQLARMLTGKTAELHELNVTKDKFFSIVAHDLRNPFNILVSYTNLLKSDFESFSKEELKQIIDDLNNATENGYNLLQNLLLWTRSQTKRIHVYKTEFNLFDVTEQVKTAIEFNLMTKNQRLIVDIEPSLIVYADKDMISTVLRNLLFNAMKFSGRGAEIFVNAIASDDYVCVEVIDSGVGISPKVIEKLFRLDSNVSTVGTDGESGTGLGLVICREFVEKNGGEIRVESDLGKGSKFSFFIPVKTG